MKHTAIVPWQYHQGGEDVAIFYVLAMPFSGADSKHVFYSMSGVIVQEFDTLDEATEYASELEPHFAARVAKVRAESFSAIRSTRLC